jgi:hypothetical protein
MRRDLMNWAEREYDLPLFRPDIPDGHAEQISSMDPDITGGKSTIIAGRMGRKDPNLVIPTAEITSPLLLFDKTVIGPILHHFHKLARSRVISIMQ